MERKIEKFLSAGQENIDLNVYKAFMEQGINIEEFEKLFYNEIWT